MGCEGFCGGYVWSGCGGCVRVCGVSGGCEVMCGGCVRRVCEEGVWVFA